MVEAARVAYRDYPTVVNEIPESGISYDNNMSEYAKMDTKMQNAQKAIGGSSDSAQLAQSYYFDRINKGIYDQETEQLYHNTIILAVLAQVAIDGCKKVFSVDANDDIARIRAQKCMQREKDFPRFIKYTREVSVTKNGKERPQNDIKKDREKIKRRIDDNIVCPMNYLEECLDKIQGASRGGIVETAEFLVDKPHGKPQAIQMGKIRKIVEDYDNFIRHNYPLYIAEDEIEIIIMKTQEVLEAISQYKISQATIYRLIETSIGLEGRTNTERVYRKASKYTNRMLSILYRTNKQKFLECFVK